MPDRLNGVDLLPITAGVLWTLRYEWGFYLVLPLAAIFLTPEHGKRLKL
jgi:peptidoglycan/LPS O-acetylase OafA/YrhL